MPPQRSRFKGDVDISVLSEADFDKYAHYAGVAQAHYHMRASCNDPKCELDTPGKIDKSICRKIVFLLRRVPDDGPRRSRLRRPAPR